MRSTLFISTLVVAAAQSPEDSVIRSGVPWYDTSGNRVYAGGANLFQESGVFWLVGEGKKVHADCSECFNLYNSTDLVTWNFVSCILRNKDILAPVQSAYYRMERPKILKCPGTQKYVMWFHCDTPSFGIQSVGVLTSDRVDGPYTFASPCFQPDGEKSYDMGTFVDERGTGKAYLIRSVRNQFAGISRMTDDCTNVTGISSSGPDMEGQAIMRDEEGILHAAGSHLTGWSANAAQFVSSPNATLDGAVWENNYNPSGSPDTWNSQSTFIFPYKHADGHTTFVWMADRWNENGPGGLDNMTNIWLPLVKSSGPSWAGQPVVEAACSGADPDQVWLVPGGGAGGPLKHAASGLCVAGDASQPLALTDCATAPSWEVRADGTIARGAGSSCVSWNAENDLPHNPGNPVIAFACDHPPAWNELWFAPTAGASGLIRAAEGYRNSSTNLCAAVAPTAQSWALPWNSAWSLKNF